MAMRNDYDNHDFFRSVSAMDTTLLRFLKFTDLNSVARDEDILLIDVEVGMRDGGKIGCAPLVKIGNELEGEFGQLVADSRQDKGTGGRQAEGSTIECAENTTT